MSWSVDPMHTQVEFSARHMGIMTVRGAFTGLTAATDFNEDDFTASSVEASIDTRTLSARDERRDAHLKSPATCIAGNMHAGFSAYATINRKDWGLTWNVALETGGLLVGEEVKLALEVEAVKAADVAGSALVQSR